MPLIAVIGSVNLDIVAKADRLPVAGETVTNAELGRFPGGKGANQALAARRLGAEVMLIACVGTDSAAEEALALLREGGVDLSNVESIDGVATGVALIIVAASGENQIVVAPGANRSLSPESLQVPIADALICQLEVPGDAVARAAQEFDGFFAVNLAPAMHVDVSILQHADLIIVNETEAAWYGNSLSACTGMIATTFGAAGAVLSKNGEDIARAKPPKINVVDTTAAGDTFTAALTIALVEGQSPEDALIFACAAGAAATTKMGAQPSLPTRADVMKLL
ncbi:MAG: ribokinase [Proteobacteria bacterium]|nr:ribokinase [Pseudomonadota bacterium]